MRKQWPTRPNAPEQAGGRTRRISPADDPTEAVERLLHGHYRPEPAAGDVLIRRERAGRSLASSMWQFRVDVVGAKSGGDRTFARYEAAAAEGEEFAARRRVRLFYVEDARPMLLMDHRSSSR